MTLVWSLNVLTKATPHAHNEFVDGRVERSAVTRRKIIKATSALLIDGVNKPTASQISQAANITPRTLFRHFADMESLYATLVDEAQANVVAVMDEPLRASANWHERLEDIVNRRVRVYELLLPLYVSTAWLEGLTDKSQQFAVKRRRTRLAEVLPDNTDPVLFEALDATLSIEFWYSLRRAQNLNVHRATSALQHAVKLLTNQEQVID